MGFGIGRISVNSFGNKVLEQKQRPTKLKQHNCRRQALMS